MKAFYIFNSKRSEVIEKETFEAMEVKQTFWNTEAFCVSNANWNIHPKASSICHLNIVSGFLFCRFRKYAADEVNNKYN